MARKKKIRLVADWKRACRWHSMRWSAAGFLLTSTAASLAMAGGAAAWSVVYSDKVVMVLAAAIFLASMIGRVISQSDDGQDDL